MTKLSLLPLLFAVSAASLPAQQTIYLKLDGVAVSGSVAPHLDEFRVLSFESGGDAAVSVLSAGATRQVSKLKFSNIKVMTAFNPTTSGIMNSRMATGTLFPGAELRFYDGSGRITSKFQLQDVYLVGLTQSGADSDINQSIELSFGKIKWWATDPRGVFSAVGGWDITMNRAW